jgi:hypothetical protein
MMMMELPTDWNEFIGFVERPSRTLRRRPRSRTLGLAELRANKKACGRPKDLADVALLAEMTRGARRRQRSLHTRRK